MRKKGFTLLYASLIVSLILGIGLAILEITYQQLLLSSSAKESKFAFYNADAGLECALYYDQSSWAIINGKIFATSSESNLPTNSFPLYTSSDLKCDGQTATNFQQDTTSNAATTSFKIIFASDVCPAPNRDASIWISVAKSVVGGVQKTHIESRGYNSCSTTNLKRVERGLYADS